jgi:ketosteroid isomerase-like protein
MSEDFERRLRRLEDREEIRSLAARYAFAVDNRDLPAIEALFARDARFRSRDGVMNATGRAAIMEQFKGRFAVLGHGAHYGHDHVIWFEESGAGARGLLSSHAELVRNGAPMIASLRYDDAYVREDGRWVFADRLLSFLYYLRTDDYLRHFGDRRRMRAYETAQDADFPEALPTWRAYHD